MGKTHILISRPGLDILQKSGKDQCDMCLMDISYRSIFCEGCSSWVHKRWRVSLTFWCPFPPLNTGPTRPVDGRPRQRSQGEAGGGAILQLHRGLLILMWWLWTRIHHKRPCSMGKFNELLTILISCSFTITSRRRVYDSCVRSAMLHASETWAPTLPDLHRLQHNDWAMTHWICGVTTKDQVISQHLERKQLDDLVKVLHTRRLRWHSHVKRSDGWLKKVQNFYPYEVVAAVALRKPG